MAKIRNIFTKSIMDKDTHIGYKEQGTYYHAENMRFINDGNNGAGTSIKGNLAINTNLLNDISEPLCLGSGEYENKIYYFVSGLNQDIIIEYDTITSAFEKVLKGNLNLNREQKITDIYVIDGLLYWNEKYHNEPRFINIERAKSWNTFTDEDISLILLPPLQEPTISLSFGTNVLKNNIKDRFFSFCYRYKDNDNGWSSDSFFSDVAFYTNNFEVSSNEFLNNGMTNAYNKVNISFNTGNRNVKEVQLCFKENESNVIYIIDTFNKKNKDWEDNTVQTISFENDKIYTARPENDTNMYYSNVPRQAYSMALGNNLLAFGKYKEGFEQVDNENNPLDIKLTLDVVSNNISERNDIEKEIDLYETKITFDFEGQEFSEGKELRVYLSYINTVEEGNPNASHRENYSNEFVFFIPLGVSSFLELQTNPQWIAFINSIKTSIQETLIHEGENLTGIDFSVSYTNTSVSIFFYKIAFEVEETAIQTIYYYKISDTSYMDFIDDNGVKSCKSLRTYSGAVAYYDKYNRLISAVKSQNSFYISNYLSASQNSLKVNLDGNPPKESYKYKFWIKEDKTDYEILYLNKYYYDNLYLYFKLEGETKNKVKDGDTLILKNYAGDNYDDNTPIKVLSLTNELSNFIADNKQPINSNTNLPSGVYSASINMKDIIEEGGLYMKIRKDKVPFDDTIVAEKISDSYIEYKRSTALGRVGLWKEDGDYSVPYEILQGSSVRIYLRNWQHTGSSIPPYPSLFVDLYDKTFYAEQNYASFVDFLNAQIGPIIHATRYTYYGSHYSSYDKSDIDFVWHEVTDGGQWQVLIDGHFEGRNVHHSRFKSTITITANTTYIFETVPDLYNEEIYNESIGTYLIENNEHSQTDIVLDYYNCYAWGNGVESYKAYDGFNKKTLYPKFRQWVIPKEGYKLENRYADITYSDFYNSETKYNGLHTFNAYTLNWKELDKLNGHIEKIIFRNSDLSVLQHRQAGKILLGKTALYNSQGIPDIQTTNDILGSYIPLSDYGCQNSETVIFKDGLLIYLDKINSKLIQANGDSFIPVSDLLYHNEMFNICKGDTFFSSYDIENGEYLLYYGKILSFNPYVKGMELEYTFVPDWWQYINGQLYSWKNGILYKHHANELYNVFYGEEHKAKLSFYVNQEPNLIKVFNALELQSSHAWDVKLYTNLNETHINKEEFSNQEGFFYASIPQSTSQDLKNAYGIGKIKDIDGLKIFVTVADKINIGDELYNSQNIKIGTIQSKGENYIELDNILTTVNIDDYVFGVKYSRVESSDLRGYYMRVDLELQSPERVTINSVGTETNDSKPI